MNLPKQLKAVTLTSSYSFQGGLMPVERVNQLDQLKSKFSLKENLNQHEEP